ncbi:ribonuclease 3 [Companilactobacillus sp. RD055328]|uniref:ribonuclease III n=1 Tax=Companilactobacillus sp. RD055328 TaxID=2916634 RepID=UPI001FC85677|nr:ribonuclease III [Companilactobacillus sp. RD055328]GKQ42576.1 ribonuclease 3 [Companilactobacillus sp. RD055328]
MIDSKFTSELHKKYNIEFQNHNLLETALTHSSYANEHQELKLEDYERLEFLGDAVLEISISEYLFKHFPEMPEGNLTRLRSAIVCTASFSKFSRIVGIDKYIQIGKGEERQGARQRDSLLEDVFEAFNGALYLDQGMEKVIEFLNMIVFPRIDAGEFSDRSDNKTLLQEKLQESGSVEIEYRVISETGNEHEKKFEIALVVNNKIVSTGTGTSKKKAEEHAAKQALNQMN